jgi:HPr kinase/phosphorylase
MPCESSEPVRIHGTLVQVLSVGLLLIGRSGIGKSECALELVMRGHRLIADDVVLISVGESGRPEGYSHELVRHYLELRGIGIVHVPSLFGPDAVAARSPIDLVIHLEAWKVGDVERLGLDRRTERISGVEVDALLLPVTPGRNVASLVEVAARNLRMQRSGRSGVAELDQRVLETLRGKPA